MLDLFIWLAYRFPDSFCGAEEVEEKRRAVSALVDASIRAMGVQRWVGLAAAGCAGNLQGRGHRADFLGNAREGGTTVWHKRSAHCPGGAQDVDWCANLPQSAPVAILCRGRKAKAAQAEAEPGTDAATLLAAAWEQQRALEEAWQQRKSSYSKRRR